MCFLLCHQPNAYPYRLRVEIWKYLLLKSNSHWNNYSNCWWSPATSLTLLMGFWDGTGNLTDCTKVLHNMEVLSNSKFTYGCLVLKVRAIFNWVRSETWFQVTLKQHIEPMLAVYFNSSLVAACSYIQMQLLMFTNILIVMNSKHPS